MDDDFYWELLEEQHEHDVVMTESRKDGSDGKLDSTDSSESSRQLD